MQDREPTIRIRILSEALRRAMDAAGLTGANVANALDWDPSKVSRMLSGKRPGSKLDVAAMLAICRVKDSERRRLLNLCDDQTKPGLLRLHGSHLPTQVVELADHENLASRIVNYEATLVPGLLQTGDYATEVVTANPNMPRAEIHERVQMRLARQALLSKASGPQYTFYIHEFVLRLPMGSALIMSDQLHSMLRLAVRPRLSLRVIPAAVGAHAALAGSFVHMEFADFHPVIYVEGETSSLFLERPEEQAAYARIVAALDAVALDEGQSRELIANLAVELYADREGS